MLERRIWREETKKQTNKQTNKQTAEYEKLGKMREERKK